MEWISVEDRMPHQPKDITTHKRYWCALESGSCYLIDWCHTISGKHEFIHNEEIASRITHWMRLPEAPKEAKK